MNWVLLVFSVYMQQIDIKNNNIDIDYNIQSRQNVMEKNYLKQFKGINSVKIEEVKYSKYENLNE